MALPQGPRARVPRSRCDPPGGGRHTPKSQAPGKPAVTLGSELMTGGQTGGQVPPGSPPSWVSSMLPSLLLTAGLFFRHLRSFAGAALVASGLGGDDAGGSPAPPSTAAPTHRVQRGQPVRRVEWGPRRPLPSWALPLTVASPSRPRQAQSQAAGWDPLSHPPGTPTPPQTCCGVRPSGMGPSSGAGGLMSETLTSRSPMSSSSESPGKGGGLVTCAG